MVARGASAFLCHEESGPTLSMVRFTILGAIENENLPVLDALTARRIDPIMRSLVVSVALSRTSRDNTPNPVFNGGNNPKALKATPHT